MRAALTASITVALIALTAVGAGCGSDSADEAETNVDQPLPEAVASDEEKALAEEINTCFTDAGLTSAVASPDEHNNIRSHIEVHVELGEPGEFSGDDAQVLILPDEASASETATGLNQSDKDFKHTANGTAVLQYPGNQDAATVTKLETCVL